FFFSSRRRHTRSKRDWSSDVCSSDLDATQTVLTVYFLGKAPHLAKANVRIDGGRRIRHIQVKNLHLCEHDDPRADGCLKIVVDRDRKSTRLNSSHVSISYAVFCLKKK